MRREKLAREAEEEALRRAAKNQQNSVGGQDATGSGKDSSVEDSDEDEADPDANPPEKPSAED